MMRIPITKFRVYLFLLYVLFSVYPFRTLQSQPFSALTDVKGVAVTKVNEAEIDQLLTIGRLPAEDCYETSTGKACSVNPEQALKWGWGICERDSTKFRAEVANTQVELMVNDVRIPGDLIFERDEIHQNPQNIYCHVWLVKLDNWQSGATIKLESKARSPLGERSRFYELTVRSDQDTIAVVLGKTITGKNKDKLRSMIFDTLREAFARENKIEPTESELDTFVLKSEEKEIQNQTRMDKDRLKLVKELQDSTLSDEKRKKKEEKLQSLDKILQSTREQKTASDAHEEQRQLAKQQVWSWKTNKALYEKYGGRVILQQTGVEPLDAYRDFLKEEAQKGSFTFIDKKSETGFWQYYTNDARHTFYTGDDVKTLVNTPWWMMAMSPHQAKSKNPH